MANIKVRHLVERGGCYYWQPSTKLRSQGWKCRRLSNSFEAAIAEAEKINAELDGWRNGETDVSQVPVVNSVESLIGSYKRSKEYRKLADNTKDDYDYRLEIIKKWAGKVPVAAITRKAVHEFWEALAKKSEWKANATVRVLRLLFNYALDLGELTVNPASRPGLASIEQRDVVWSFEEEEAFIHTADKLGYFNFGTSILLAAYLAQREGDILNFDWQDYKGGAFFIRQHKTGAYICVPVHPILKARLDKYTNRNGLIIKSDITGQKFTRAAFNHIFARVRKIVSEEHPDIMRCKFLDLRRTAVVRLAEAGCTEAQISAVSGHKIDTCRRILEVYLPRNSAMARDAIKKYTAYLPAA